MKIIWIFHFDYSFTEYLFIKDPFDNKSGLT